MAKEKAEPESALRRGELSLSALDSQSAALERLVSMKLLSNRIDGALLIDIATGTLVPLSRSLTGKLWGLMDLSDLSYERTCDILIDKAVVSSEGGFLKERVKLSNVLDKLKKLPIYSLEFKIKEESGLILFKRLNYSFCEEMKGSLVVSCEDVTSLRRGDIDPLTGLLDASGFHDRVASWIKENPGKKYRIQRYNIDHFRDINGIYGHASGDQLLKDFGSYMRKYDTPDSFSAHLNADHFARFCGGETKSVDEYARLVPKAFASYHLKMPIKVHIGVYDLCEEDNDSALMAYKALLALQTIKGDYARTIAYYKKGMMKEEVEEQELLASFDEGLAEGQFEVWYQPQVNYASGKLVGGEALVRWRHPSKGLLAPGRFLPVIERAGKIGDLDKATIRRVLSFALEWAKEKGGDTPSFSCNLSRAYLLDASLPSFLEGAVGESSLPKKAIHFEITEGAYVKDAELIEKVASRLRKEGFICEMDDFGSAYSSLNSLKSIHVDVVKLDLRFLGGEEEGKRSKIILSSVIEMVKRLGMEVIAEGVESKEQADMLLEFGCELMQGYYFSKPVPEEEYARMLSGEVAFPKGK